MGFHSIGFPCERGAPGEAFPGLLLIVKVSIQLVSPARGEFTESVENIPNEAVKVSIQLVSPARGEKSKILILFPIVSGVSIQLVSPARGEVIPLRPMTKERLRLLSFHSIGFPCERGAQELQERFDRKRIKVSIQLVSPARGELLERYLMPQNLPDRDLFPFNWFPLREGRIPEELIALHTNL